MSARRRAAAGLAVLLAGGAALLLVGTREPDLLAAQAVETLSTRGVDGTAPTSSRLPSLQAEPGDPVEVRAKRLIEGVTLDPEAPCAGDDVRVDVTPLSSAGPVKVVVGRQHGASAIVRFEAAGPQAVRVVARDFTDGMERRVVPVEVRACPPSPRLAVEITRLSANEVQVRVDGAEAGRAIQWDFGDGTPPVVAAGPVAHDYSLRPQKGPQSSFVVTATDGDRRGRASVGFTNVHFLSSGGEVTFLPVQAPRFATPGAAGDVELAATVRNLFEVPARFEAATLTGFPCAAGAQPEVLGLSAAAVGAGALPVDGTTRLALRLPLSRFAAPVCSVEIRLEGRAETGAAVAALFGLDTGRPADAEVVADADLRGRLRRARQLLGRTRVTPADLAALDAAGTL